MHLYADDSVAATCLAASALDIEAEPALLVAAKLCLWQAREQVSDAVEHSRVCRWVGTRSSADWRLVDVDDLVDVLKPEDSIVFARLLLQAVRHMRRPFI